MVSTIEDSDSITFDEVESAIIEICNMIENILRHTFATRLCESGINLKVIQSVLGHADVSTTMNIYVDVTSSLKKKEIAAFGDYLASSSI